MMDEFITMDHGSGGVKTDAAGKRCLVAQVDTAAKTVTVEL